MRQALLFGISDYGNQNHPLSASDLENLPSAKNDTKRLKELLSDGGDNFKITTVNECRSVGDFTDRLSDFFNKKRVDVSLFYFSGHGVKDREPKLVVSDFQVRKDGINISKVIELANYSDSENVIIILDCCFAGALDDFYGESLKGLREGVSIIGACGPEETAKADPGGYSLFTSHFIKALEGWAADEQGRITIPAIYHYIIQNLPQEEQRPVFRCNLLELIEIRKIDYLSALNIMSEKMFDRVTKENGKCHVKIVYRKEDYLKLLEESIQKAQKEVLFTSSRICDTRESELGPLQLKINKASKSFKLRNPNRIHLGLVADASDSHWGAIQLRAEASDIVIKFHPYIDMMEYNFFIWDEKNVIIRLKNKQDNEMRYAISVENKSLARYLRDIFLSLWHERSATLMYAKLTDFLDATKDVREEITEVVFNKRPDRLRDFINQILQTDIAYRLLGKRAPKTIKARAPFPDFEKEDPACHENFYNLIESFNQQRLLQLFDIQSVYRNIENSNIIDYNLHSKVFLFQFFMANYYKVRHTLIELSKLLEFRSPINTVLDLGGGGGASLAAFFDYLKTKSNIKPISKTYLVDNSKNQIELAEKILTGYEAYEPCLVEAKTFLETANSLKFDLVISSNFLCESSSIQRINILQWLAKRLNPDGYFLVVERVESLVYDTIIESELFELKRYKFSNERFNIPDHVETAISSKLGEGSNLLEHMKSNYTLRYALFSPRNTGKI